MKALDDEITSSLEQFLSQYSDIYEYSISDYDVIEIQAINKIEEKGRIIMLRFGTNDDHQQIYISNIHTPDELKHKGIGKMMIYIIYNLAKEYGYDTCLVQLTDGFRERLIKRGAITTNENYDTLMIGENTNLL